MYIKLIQIYLNNEKNTKRTNWLKNNINTTTTTSTNTNKNNINYTLLFNFFFGIMFKAHQIYKEF